MYKALMPRVLADKWPWRVKQEKAMGNPLRVVHYVNQFFGGIGGEDVAHVGVSLSDATVGSSRALQQALGRIIGRHARRADLSRQSLCDEPKHRRGDEERLDSHIE